MTYVNGYYSQNNYQNSVNNQHYTPNHYNNYHTFSGNSSPTGQTAPQGMQSVIYQLLNSFQGGGNHYYGGAGGHFSGNGGFTGNINATYTPNQTNPTGTYIISGGGKGKGGSRVVYGQGNGLIVTGGGKGKGGKKGQTVTQVVGGFGNTGGTINGTIDGNFQGGGHFYNQPTQGGGHYYGGHTYPNNGGGYPNNGGHTHGGTTYPQGGGYYYGNNPGGHFSGNGGFTGNINATYTPNQPNPTGGTVIISGGGKGKGGSRIIYGQDNGLILNGGGKGKGGKKGQTVTQVVGGFANTGGTINGTINGNFGGFGHYDSYGHQHGGNFGYYNNYKW